MEKRILIVDDDKLFARSLCEELTKQNFICKPVFTRNSAIKHLRADTYDLLLCDIRLPSNKNEGVKLIKQVRALEKSDTINNIGIICISAWKDFKPAVEALRLGVFDYLVKGIPLNKYFKKKKKYFESRFESDEIVKALQDWIDRHPEPDKKLYFAGDKGVSAREMLEHIKNGTDLGQEYLQALTKLTLDMISKARK